MLDWAPAITMQLSNNELSMPLLTQYPEKISNHIGTCWHMNGLRLRWISDLFVAPSFRLAARARVKKNYSHKGVNVLVGCLKHFLVWPIVSMAYFRKWAGNYCFADKQSRKWLSQIVAKYKERILKCERYTVIYSTLFHAFAQGSHLEHF